MKKRNQERTAKIFALVVVILMIFQVLLPLFNAMNTAQPAVQQADNSETVQNDATVPTSIGTETPSAGVDAPDAVK